MKPDTMDKSQKRAMADLRCAARKLAALFRSEGLEADAVRLERTVEEAGMVFDRTAKEHAEAEEGGAA